MKSPGPRHSMGLPYMPISWGGLRGQCGHIIYGIHGVFGGCHPVVFFILVPSLRSIFPLLFLVGAPTLVVREMCQVAATRLG